MIRAGKMFRNILCVLVTTLALSGNPLFGLDVERFARKAPSSVDCVGRNCRSNDTCSSGETCLIHSSCDLNAKPLCYGACVKEACLPVVASTVCPTGTYTCQGASGLICATPCDDSVECLDQSDESNCACDFGQILCSDGTSMICATICDGQAECSDGSDESIVGCDFCSTMTNIRLKDGGGVGVDLPDRGRVEIYYRGVWGTVCDDDFDANAATVVCRSLGYTSGLYQYFGPGSGEILLDDTECDGDEACLLNCCSILGGFGFTGCGHHEDSGVICS